MIARRIFETGAVQVITLFVGVVSGIFVTRLLGPEGRGVYAVFKANSELLVLLAGFGMGSVITYYVSNKNIRLEKLLGLSVLGFFASITLVLGILLAVYNSSAVAIFFPEGYRENWFLLFLYVQFVVGIVAIILTGFLNGRTHFVDTNTAKVINGVLFLVALVVLTVFLASADMVVKIQYVFGALVGGGVVMMVLLALFFKRRYRGELSVSLNVKEPLIVAASFVYLVYLGELINFFNYRLDVWLVEYYESSYQLGLYTLAVSVSQTLWLIAIPVTIVLLPHLNNPDNADENKRLFFFMRESLLA